MLTTKPLSLRPKTVPVVSTTGVRAGPVSSSSVRQRRKCSGSKVQNLRQQAPRTPQPSTSGLWLCGALGRWVNTDSHDRRDLTAENAHWALGHITTRRRCGRCGWRSAGEAARSPGCAPVREASQVSPSRPRRAPATEAARGRSCGDRRGRQVLARTFRGRGAGNQQGLAADLEAHLPGGGRLGEGPARRRRRERPLWRRGAAGGRRGLSAARRNICM